MVMFLELVYKSNKDETGRFYDKLKHGVISLF